MNKLIINGSGKSIKSWFLYGTMICGFTILVVLGGVLVYDVVYDGKVDSSMSDISSVITAIAGLFVSGGLPKIVGEIKEAFGRNENNVN